MNNGSEYIIREMVDADHDQVLDLIMDAFESKFKFLGKVSDMDKKEIMRRVEFGISGAEERSFVAVKGKKVLGVIALKYGNSSGQERLDFGELWKIGKSIGFWKAFKFILGLSLLDEKVEKGECYIKHVAVAEEARGLGLGTDLINSRREWMLSIGGVKYMSLYVADSNHGAFKLYDRLGFKVQCALESWITQVLVREKKWYYMYREVE